MTFTELLEMDINEMLRKEAEKAKAAYLEANPGADIRIVTYDTSSSEVLP